MAGQTHQDNPFWNLHADGEVAYDGSSCTDRCRALGCLVARYDRPGQSGQGSSQPVTTVPHSTTPHSIPSPSTKPSSPRSGLNPQAANFRPFLEHLTIAKKDSTNVVQPSPTNKVHQQRVAEWVAGQSSSVSARQPEDHGNPTAWVGERRTYAEVAALRTADATEQRCI